MFKCIVNLKNKSDVTLLEREKKMRQKYIILTCIISQTMGEKKLYFGLYCTI